MYRRLGGPQGRSGRVRKISPPPGFDPRTVQPVANRYTDCAIPTRTVEKGMKEILKLAIKITNHLDICLERLNKTTKIRSKCIRYNSEYDTTKSSSCPCPVDSARITPVTSQQEMSSQDMLDQYTILIIWRDSPCENDLLIHEVSRSHNEASRSVGLL